MNAQLVMKYISRYLLKNNCLTVPIDDVLNNTNNEMEFQNSRNYLGEILKLKSKKDMYLIT